MIAAGLDLGGTKIEAQVFDHSWNVIDRARVETPKDYDALVDEIRDLIRWCEETGGVDIPVGIGAAGLVNPKTGLALTANFCADGRPFPADIERAAGRSVPYINDCRALALSEAVFGAGQGHSTVMSLILGTGIGGGVAYDRALRFGPTMTGGEFGHCSAPAGLVAKYDLPVFECGCGRAGCIETYIAGPGLARLAKAMLGRDLTPPQIAAARHGDCAEVWQVWLAFCADLIRNLTMTVDPDIIIIGGGLSKVDGVADALWQAANDAQIGDFTVPPIVTAQGGDASGARGAAYAAWQAAHG